MPERTPGGARVADGAAATAGTFVSASISSAIASDRADELDRAQCDQREPPAASHGTVRARPSRPYRRRAAEDGRAESAPKTDPNRT